VNKKGILGAILAIVLVVVGGFVYQDYQQKEAVKRAEQERRERVEQFKSEYFYTRQVLKAEVMPFLYQKEREIQEAKRLAVSNTHLTQPTKRIE
jgi:uncharacterized protein HemX